MSSPLRLAKTGPSDQNEPLTRPTLRQPTKPTGESRQRPAMSRPMVTGRGGSGALVSDTGTRAMAMRIATSANGSKPAGSYAVSRNWPAISTHRQMNV